MFFEKMQTRKNDGFTLVELIVVIAILAILAGIAVPAYSGYIEKANVAADQQLLHTVNTAFAAACADKGVDASTLSVSTADVPLSSGKVQSANVKPAAIVDSFQLFYGGNNDAAFKTVSRLFFDQATSSFVISGNLTFTYGGSQITISAEDAQNLASSTYAESIGAEGLLNKVNDVSKFASALDGSASYNAVLTDPAFMKTMLKNMGYSDETIQSLEQNGTLTNGYYEVLGGLAEDRYYLLLEQNNLNEEDMTLDQMDEWYAKAESQVKANVAVLHAAQNTTGMDNTTINNLLNSNTPKADIITALNNDPGQGLAQAALYYGLYTSFANSSDYKSDDRITATNDPLKLLNSLTDSELKAFQTYINSDQGKADLNAYTSSMGMINDGVSDPTAVQNVLVNGYNNQELVDLMTGVMGK